MNLKIIIYLFLSGVLYASGFPILGTNYLFPLGPSLSIVFLTLLLFKISIPKKFISTLVTLILSVFIFGLGLYAFGFYWIPHTLYEFGNVPSSLSQLAGFFSPLVLMPPLYLLAALIFFRRKIIGLTPQLNEIFCWVILFLFLARLVPMQFPIFPGHSFLIFAPYLKLGNILGVAGYDFLGVSIAFALVYGFRTKQIHWGLISFASLFVVLHLFWPSLELEESEKVKIRIVQANISSESKTSSENGEYTSISDIVSAHYDLSNEPGFSPDLIIWPETAYPLPISSTKINSNTDFLPLALQTLNAENPSEIFFGVRDVTPSDELTNAGGFLRKNNKLEMYYKNKLLPFGEDLPFGFLNDYLKPMFPMIAFFYRGHTSELFKLQNEKSSFKSLICYEVLFSSLVREHLNRHQELPNFLINITNDSWYGDTSEPHQHLFLSRWRSIEYGVPLVRSANTGISAIISPWGEVVAKLDLNTKGNLDSVVQTYQSRPTYFSKYGNITNFILGVFLIILSIFSLKRNLHAINHEVE